jgi:hypothetical protein
MNPVVVNETPTARQMFDRYASGDWMTMLQFLKAAETYLPNYNE